VTLPLIYALDHSSNGYLGDVTKVIQDPDDNSDLIPIIVQWVNQSGGTERAIGRSKPLCTIGTRNIAKASI